MASRNQPNQRAVIGSYEVSTIEDVSRVFFFFIMTIILDSFLSHITKLGTIITTWNRVMAMELTTKNKIGFVDGTIPRATQIDILFNAWNHCNNIVIA